jgi:hypothetical protein
LAALLLIFLFLQKQDLKGQETAPVSIWEAENNYIFKTNLKLYGNEFSGLFVINKTKENHFRTIFLNEVGMKFFDFQIGAEDDSILHVFEPLNKPSLIKLLINDYRTLLFLPKTEDCRRLKTKKNKHICKSGKYNYQFNATDSRLHEIYQRIFFMKPFLIEMNNYDKNFPGKIRISHKFIKFEQSLYLLENQ